VKRGRLAYAILCQLVFLTGCEYYDGIPIIGFDANHNPVQIFVPAKQYSSRMAALATNIYDSALPVVKQRETQSSCDPSSCQGTDHSHWSLRAIAIGVGVQSEIGIGPFRLGAVPKTRLIFTNLKDPYPM
jgi:hypothetical protein